MKYQAYLSNGCICGLRFIKCHKTSTEKIKYLKKLSKYYVFSYKGRSHDEDQYDEHIRIGLFTF